MSPQFGCRSPAGNECQANIVKPAFSTHSIAMRLFGAIRMKSPVAGLIGLSLAFFAPASASDIEGPARFCGYSPIIDLLPGEKITILAGGIHGGTFRWEGAFGVLDVHGIGWASRPEGRIVKPMSASRPARFAQRRARGGDQGTIWQVAIWNGAHGAAYFTSPEPFSTAQLTAIDRVTLYEEGQTPSGCKLRTVFSWE